MRRLLPNAGPFQVSSAIFSECGTYRYTLERAISMTGQGTLLSIGVNSSTADAKVNDPTIRKDMGFAERWGFARLLKGNLFAYRATDVRELRHTNRPEGEFNDEYLLRMMKEADKIVVGWGALAKLPIGLRGRWKAIPLLAKEAGGKPLYCLGTALDGQPLHPLYIPYDRALEEWSPLG